LVELVHAASLLHDDVVDRSSLRRGKETVHSLWGERQAVLLGDLFLAHGLHLLAPHATRPILETVSLITQDLARGQLLELEAEGDLHLSASAYLAIIEGKTATFFGHCAHLGGLAGALPKQDLPHLHHFGVSVGFAYQMLDDLLDYSTTSEELGKPVGADVTNQRLTLPLLRMLEEERYSGPVIQALQARDTIFLRQELPSRIRASGAFQVVVEEAREECQKAHTALTKLASRKNLAPLIALTEYLFERVERLT
jgi:octaprenyl-diphosphate synthase